MHLSHLSPHEMRPEGQAEMFTSHCFSMFLFLLLLCSSSRRMSNALNDALKKQQSGMLSLGAVVDYTSLAGKKEKVAMDMAVKDIYDHANHQNFPSLHAENSRGDPFRAAASGENNFMCCFVTHSELCPLKLFPNNK